MKKTTPNLLDILPKGSTVDIKTRKITLPNGRWYTYRSMRDAIKFATNRP